MLQFPYKLDSVLTQLKKRYHEDLVDFRDYVKIDFSNELLSDDFHQTFFQLLNSEGLDQYGPMKHYWLKMVEDFFYILELHYDEQDGGLSDDDQEFSEEEREEELLAAWEQTPFASAMEGMLDEGLSPIDSSMALVPLMESQILAFAYLHFYRDEFECETAFLYNMAPEFGDFETRLNLLGSHQYVEFEGALELYPVVPIAEVDCERNTLGLDNNGETDYIDIQEYEKSIQLDKGKKLFVIPGMELSSDQLDEMTLAIKQVIESSKERSAFCSTQLSYIIISSNPASCCANLPEVIHLSPWKNLHELEKNLDAAICSLALEHLQMAWELVSEDDVSPRFIDPFDGKKSLLLPIMQKLLIRHISREITEKEKVEFKKLYAQVKNTDLLVSEIKLMIDTILK